MWTVTINGTEYNTYAHDFKEAYSFAKYWNGGLKYTGNGYRYDVKVTYK